jgi:hypothetical protein
MRHDVALIRIGCDSTVAAEADTPAAFQARSRPTEYLRTEREPWHPAPSRSWVVAAEDDTS